MPQDPDDPYGLGIQPLGASGRVAPPSEDDPYGLGIQPLGGVGRSGGRQQPEESHWYDNIATVPNAIRFGGSLAGDYAGGLLAPVTGGLSYPVLSFLGGALGELGGQIAGGEDLNLWTAGTEGALNLVPGPNIPGERALLGDVVKYGAKSAISGAGQGILGTNPRKWAQEGMFNDQGNVNWASPEEYASQASSGAIFGGLTGAALAGGKALNDRIPITKSQNPIESLHGLKMIGEGTHDNWVEPDSLDWRNPKEADIIEGEVLPHDAPPWEPWKNHTPPTEPPPTPPPSDPAGDATINQPNDLNSPFGADEVAVGDSFDVPDLDVTNEYIDQMRDMGFERAGKLPGGRTLFQRVVSKLGEEKGSIPSFDDIYKTLKGELGREPSVAEIEAETSKYENVLEFQPREGETDLPPGTQVGRVADFDPLARQLTQINSSTDIESLRAHAIKLNEILTRNEGSPDHLESARILLDETTDRIAQLKKASPFGKMMPTADARAQFEPELDQSLHDISGGRVSQPRGNFGDDAWEESPTDMTHTGPVGVVQPTESGIEDLRAGNVSQFPVQPSVEDRQVESFHKGMMGDVATRAAQMQQRVAELQQKYPNVPVEWIQRIQVAERNIARHLQSPRVDTANVQQMIADNQRRIDILTERMEAYNNAYMGGPSGLVPTNRPTESGIENLRPQAVLGEDEWGPITPGHAESLLPQQPRDGEILPPEQSTETDMFGFPADRDLTDEEVAQAKRAFLMRENLGPDMVENQQFLDDATGTIGDEKLHYPGMAEGGEKNITPTGMEPYRPPVQSGEILPPAATDYGPNAQAFLMRLKHTGVPLDVTDMTRLKPFLDSLDDPNAPEYAGNRDEPSMQRAYTDLTPDQPKRYEVYDENDNLIHKTYDYDEAHRMADQENGYVNDTEQSRDEPSMQRTDPQAQAKSEIGEVLKQRMIAKINENIDAGRNPMEGVAEIQESIAQLNKTPFQTAWDKLSHEGKRLVAENTHMERPGEKPSRQRVDSRSIVQAFREKLPPSKADNWSDVDFILPDGTKLTHGGVSHISGAEAAGHDLEDAMRAGIIRVARDNAGVEIHSPITKEQAEVLADMAFYKGARTSIDVMRPDGEMVSRTFTKGSEVRDIREWVNGRVSSRGDDERPALAKVEGGGLVFDADLTRAVTNLTKDYTGALSAVMVREMGQNNFDAVKDMHTGGKVHFRIGAKALDANGNQTPGFIESYDNGSGMDEVTLAEKLVRLFGSGKENEQGAAGGKGIGSASYIMGGEHFEVITVAIDSHASTEMGHKPDGKKYRITAGGTPQSFFDRRKGGGSSWKKELVPMSTPTGTTVKTILKDDQDTWDARDMFNNMVNHSRDKSMTIIVDERNHTRSLPISELTADGYWVIEHKIPSTKDDKVIGDYTFNTNEIKVQIPKFDENIERTYYRIHFLNSGMYQFSKTEYFEETKGLPGDVIVNITPTVDEQDAKYPFINTRQDVKDDLREQVMKFVKKNLSGPAVERKKNRTQELYDQMPLVKVPGAVRKNVIFDPGERMTKGEMTAFKNHPIVKELMAHYDSVTDSALRIIGRQDWSDRLEGIGIIMDPTFNGIHIPNPTTKKSTIGLNVFARMEGGMSPQDNAFNHTITLWHEIAHIGTQAGFGDIQTPNIDMSDPRAAKFWQSYLEQLVGHGDVGYKDTGHGVGFIQRLGEVYAKLGASHTFRTAEQLEKILTGGRKSGGYDPELQRLLQIYSDSRRQPETTEDLLSGTGVKQANKRSTGKGSLPPPDSPVGTGTPAGTAVELFRRNLPAVTDYETTRFILPDGHRVGFKGSSWGAEDYHSPAARGAGVPMDEALENGIVRFRPSSQNVAAEVHAPITSSQAVHLSDSLYMLDKPYLIMEVMAPSGQRQHTIFEQGTKPGKIREWVSNIFRKLSDEKGAWNVFGRQTGTPPPHTPNYNTGGAASPPPPGGGHGGLGGSGSTPGAWGSVKQATGWGSGGKVVQNKQQLNWIKEAMAVPAGATTTMDLSAPFRQGLSMINTPQFWKAAYKMFGGLTEAGFNQIDAELRRKPVMQARRNTRTGKVMPSIAQEAGLKMFETAGTGGMNQRAQATASRWLEEGIGQGIGSKAWKNTVGVPIRMSNRAYITFLNHLKVNRFEYLMDLSAKMHQDVRATGTARPGLFRQKFTQAEGVELNGYRNKVLAKEIADFVNTATGQGPLKTHVLPFKQAEVSLEGAAEALQHTFFSPGLIASRVRMLNPSTYIMASPMVRKQYMGAALATGAAWMGALGLIKAGGGDDVEVNLDNLTSADFGKAKIGDMRMDPGGGFQQFLVAMGRLIQGGTTSSASNEWQEFGKGFNAPTQKSNIERFLSNKLNPVTKFAYDLAAQSEYNPFHVGDRTAQLFVPLVIQDLIGLYQENPKLLPWMGPVLFGMGTQTYGRGESVGKLINPENDWLATGGGVKDLVTSDQENY